MSGVSDVGDCGAAADAVSLSASDRPGDVASLFQGEADKDSFQQFCFIKNVPSHAPVVALPVKLLHRNTAATFGSVWNVFFLMAGKCVRQVFSTRNAIDRM